MTRMSENVHDATPHEVDIGMAYVAGMNARKGGASVETNPFYLVTQQTLAWNSGWRDQGVWFERHSK